MRRFCRKLLRRLDGMDMPFYPKVGLMSHKEAQHRYVTGLDPWSPAESPFLDGVAIEFAHCVADTLDPRAWFLFAEIGFDVAKLAQIGVVWGGFAYGDYRPGVFCLGDAQTKPAGWITDGRTYGARGVPNIEMKFEGE